MSRNGTCTPGLFGRLALAIGLLIGALAVAGPAHHVYADGDVAIDSGSATGAGSFVSDRDVVGGFVYHVTNAAIDTSGVTNPAPQEVYQTERFAGPFTYTIPALTPTHTYTVRLHFAEVFFTPEFGYSSCIGKRVFNVAVQGTTTQDLVNFDICKEAGGPDKALVKEFQVTPNAAGQIVVAYTDGAANVAKSSGLEVIDNGPPPPCPTAPGCTTDATPELGSGELLATGLLPLGAVLLYRRRHSKRATPPQ